MKVQALLFELPAQQIEREKRMQAILKDRRIARYLIQADLSERATIEVLMECYDYSLYEAIEMCIKHPLPK